MTDQISIFDGDKPSRIMKDWTGNKQSALSMLGARVYAKEEREENDYYATEPVAVSLLLGVERFSPMIWECACGEGHISRELERAGYHVYSSDLIDRGYGMVQDFLQEETPPSNDIDIVTNPPYSKAKEFVDHAMQIIEDGHKVAMFLKLQFLESKSRLQLFKKWPIKTVYVSVKRLRCAKNGDFKKYAKSNAVCYAWFVWQKGYAGATEIKWI